VRQYLLYKGSRERSRPCRAVGARVAIEESGAVKQAPVALCVLQLLAFTMASTNGASAATVPACAFPSCQRAVWKDAGGAYSLYCGTTHRDAMANARVGPAKAAATAAATTTSTPLCKVRLSSFAWQGFDNLGLLLLQHCGKRPVFVENGRGIWRVAQTRLCELIRVNINGSARLLRSNMQRTSAFTSKG
jgi:hypothetical protein